MLADLRSGEVFGAAEREEARLEDSRWTARSGYVVDAIGFAEIEAVSRGRASCMRRETREHFKPCEARSLVRVMCLMGGEDVETGL